VTRRRRPAARPSGRLTHPPSRATGLPQTDAAAPAPAASARLLNRELAWLEFNARVLEEALDPAVPLLERVKFLAIFSSNLDEFFMVRVAGLKRQVDAGVHAPGPDGLAPAGALEAISARLRELVARQHAVFEGEIAPALAGVGVRLLEPEALGPEQRAFLADYFRRTILPVVTPLAIDPGHPFPFLANRTICVALELRRREDGILPTSELAIVHIPSSVLPRFIRLPGGPDAHDFIALEDAIAGHAEELFAGYEIVSSNALRVTRDSEIVIDEEAAGDLLTTIEEGVRERRNGAAVRLQHDAALPAAVLEQLREALELDPRDLYSIHGHIAFSDLMQLYAEVDLPALKDPPLVPQRVPSLEREPSLFLSIAKGDALVHHPYQSFDYVVRFLAEAAEDPAVLAIKMTLYRVGGASPIVEALRLAARNGKQVAVLMELKARFEEQANIAWARKLEAAGAHVIYGLPGFKTHAKACLVVRKEGAGLRRYCHLSTGNYNARTAWVYADMGIFSCRDDLCDEVAALFNLITGYCRPPAFKHLAIAPEGLRARLLALIGREAAHAAAGRPGRIVAKMNGLEDAQVIEALYAAGAAGVEIDLIVRGICCLRPGVAGLSERIRVIRIVDRFLEHARILFVANGGSPELFLASADWMPRNLDRRVEVLFPILDPALGAEAAQVLAAQLRDDTKARAVGASGENVRRAPGSWRCQERLVELARATARGEAPRLGL
jgi:polyphosphate kinase